MGFNFLEGSNLCAFSPIKTLIKRKKNKAADDRQPYSNELPEIRTKQQQLQKLAKVCPPGRSPDLPVQTS